MEVVHYLQRQLADSQPEIDRFLDLEATTVATLTRDDVSNAAALLRNHSNTGIGGRDATVVAAMDRHDVSTLWTHDSGLEGLGEHLEWLTVVNPVTDALE